MPARLPCKRVKCKHCVQLAGCFTLRGNLGHNQAATSENSREHASSRNRLLKSVQIWRSSMIQIQRTRHLSGLPSGFHSGKVSCLHAVHTSHGIGRVVQEIFANRNCAMRRTFETEVMPSQKEVTSLLCRQKLRHTFVKTGRNIPLQREAVLYLCQERFCHTFVRPPIFCM